MADRLTVNTAGISCVQDLGRYGGARVGLSVNGALDQYSAMAANVLTGEPATAALIEITALDFACTVSTDLVVAVTGAPADVHVRGIPVQQWEPVVVPAGARIEVSGIRTGLRVYLAVHGALDVPALMGSVAPDPSIGFGGTLATGDVVPLRSDFLPLTHPVFGLPVFALGARIPRFTSNWTIDMTDGPDAAEFAGWADLLTSSSYTITPQSNHIGLRLAGPVPRRSSNEEVLSRGVPIGAVEVPAGDELLVLHRGRGVTAGYPVPAVVTAASLDALGQARSGHTVRFRRRTVAEAIAAQRDRQTALEALTDRVERVFAALGVSTARSRATR